MTNDDGGSYRNANFDDNFTGRSQVPFWYHVMVIMVRTFNDGDMGVSVVYSITHLEKRGFLLYFMRIHVYHSINIAVVDVLNITLVVLVPIMFIHLTTNLDQENIWLIKTKSYV